MYKGQLYRSNSNPFRIRIVDITSDKVKAQKLVDSDLKYESIIEFDYQDLKSMIDKGEWQLDYNTPGQATGKPLV